MFKKLLCITILNITIIANFACAKPIVTDSANRLTPPKPIGYIGQGDNCTVAKVDLEKGITLATINLMDPGKHNVCIISTATTPNQLYVIESDRHHAYQFVQIFDIHTLKLITTIPLSIYPLSNILPKPDGSHVYISSYGASGENTVWDINTASLKVTKVNLGVWSNPGAMAISSDGAKLYVATEGNNNISVVDTTQNVVVDSIQSITASLLALSHDGKTLYANWRNILTSIDTITLNKKWTKYLNNDSGLNLVLSYDDKTIYTSSPQGLSAIDINSMVTTNIYPTKHTLWGIAINPDGKVIYTLDYDSGKLIALKTDPYQVSYEMQLGLNLEEITVGLE